MSGVTTSLDNSSIELTLCLTTPLTLQALCPSSRALVLCTRVPSSCEKDHNLLSSIWRIKTVEYHLKAVPCLRSLCTQTAHTWNSLKIAFHVFWHSRPAAQDLLLDENKLCFSPKELGTLIQRTSTRDDGKSAFSVRGVVRQSVSSIEGLSREMVTPEMRSNRRWMRSDTPLSEQVSILSRQNHMSRCGCLKVIILSRQNAMVSLCCFESEHSVETRCNIWVIFAL